MGTITISARSEQQVCQEVKLLIEKWNKRLSGAMPLELSSEVAYGGVTQEIYDQRERDFTNFGLDILDRELRILAEEGYSPRYYEEPLSIIEVGAGTGQFVRFAKSALDQGYKYKLYDCSDVAIDTAQELLGEAVMKNGAMKYDIYQVVQYGILHEIISQQKAVEMVLGVFYRVLQHNRNRIKEVLRNLPHCTLPFGRVVIAHPFGEDNEHVEYSRTGRYRSFPFTREFMLDQINRDLGASAQWDILRADQHQRGQELYTFAVLGPKSLRR